MRYPAAKLESLARDFLEATGSSEDDQRRAETEIQKITDRFIGEVDKVVAEKDKEIMTV